MIGVYCYVDLKTDDVVYIGKDSHIDENRRHRQHLSPSCYNEQQINRVLQNTPQRYKYKVLKKGDFSQNLLNALEILYIRRYSPKFNYTIGGEGSLGCKLSKETKEKLRKAHLGKKGTFTGRKHTLETRKKMSQNHADVSGENNPMYGKHLSEEAKKKLSLANTGENSPHYGIPKSKTHREKISKSQNTSGYFRVNKQNDKKCKQGFKWRYQYYDKNGNRKVITSVDINKLEEKVKSKGLEWFKIEIACGGS